LQRVHDVDEMGSLGGTYRPQLVHQLAWVHFILLGEVEALGHLTNWRGAKAKKKDRVGDGDGQTVTVVAAFNGF
jgi:hypothetical protein